MAIHILPFRYIDFSKWDSTALPNTLLFRLKYNKLFCIFVVSTLFEDISNIKYVFKKAKHDRTAVNEIITLIFFDLFQDYFSVFSGDVIVI